MKEQIDKGNQLEVSKQSFQSTYGNSVIEQPLQINVEKYVVLGQSRQVRFLLLPYTDIKAKWGKNLNEKGEEKKEFSEDKLGGHPYGVVTKENFFK